jgi:hypothetical protein
VTDVYGADGSWRLYEVGGLGTALVVVPDRDGDAVPDLVASTCPWVVLGTACGAPAGPGDCAWSPAAFAASGAAFSGNNTLVAADGITLGPTPDLVRDLVVAPDGDLVGAARSWAVGLSVADPLAVTLRLDASPAEEVCDAAVVLDADGDGADDALVAASSGGVGTVWTVPASTVGVPLDLATIGVVRGTGAAPALSRLAAVGDWDGDGCDDAVVSSPGTGEILLVAGVCASAPDTGDTDTSDTGAETADTAESGVDPDDTADACPTTFGWACRTGPTTIPGAVLVALAAYALGCRPPTPPSPTNAPRPFSSRRNTSPSAPTKAPPTRNTPGSRAAPHPP